MANPYTQDITPTVKAIQKSREPSYADQVTSLFATYLQKDKEKLDENIKTLSTDFVAEKQTLAKRLGYYQEALQLKDTIDKDYGGNIYNYALNETRKQYENRVASQYGVQGKEGWRIFDDNTETTSKEYLEPAARDYEKRLQTLFDTAGKIDINVDSASTYTDDMFTNAINTLPSRERSTSWGILGDLISGKGLNTTKDYGTTRQDILDRVFSDIPNKELGELGEQFKNLYAADPKYAQIFEKEIAPNIKVGTSVKDFSNERVIEIEGLKTRVLEQYSTYIDKQGKTQKTSTTTTVLSEDEVPLTTEQVVSLNQELSDKGSKTYRELKEAGKKSHEILEALNQDLDNFKNPTIKGIEAMYTNPQNTKVLTGLYNSWQVQNGFATLEEVGFGGKTTVIPVEGASDKEGYLTYEEWKRKEMNSAKSLIMNIPEDDDALAKNSIPVENEQGIIEAYNLGSTSFESPLFVQSMIGKNEAIQSPKDNRTVSLNVYALESLGLDKTKFVQELENEFNDKDYSRVSSGGIYFDKANPLIIQAEELPAVGITEISEPIELGYNIKDHKFVMRYANRNVVEFSPLSGKYSLENPDLIVNEMDLDSLTDGQLLNLYRNTGKGNMFEKLNMPKDIDIKDGKLFTGMFPGPDVFDLFSKPKIVTSFRNRIENTLKERLPENVNVDGYLKFSPPEREEEIPEGWWTNYQVNNVKGTGETFGATQRGGKYNEPKENNSLLSPTDSKKKVTNSLTFAESSNNPDALWKQSQRNTFKDFTPTESTLEEVLEFTKFDGEYADWSRAQSKKKTTHTPVGKYQFVGATLRDIKNRGGFDDLNIDNNTIFTEEVQDKLFEWYIKDTIKAVGKDASQEQKRNKIRKRFEGATTKNVSNEELDLMIEQILTDTYST